MANFRSAYETIMTHEGGYSNDPVDAGGETYKGISRRYHPDWAGWSIIDQLKDSSNFPDNLSHSPQLQEMVVQFYKNEYWDIFWGDQIPVQSLATDLFDIAVNLGRKRAVRFLQKALNLLNRNQQNYPDITEDGVFGTNTMNTLNQYLSMDDVNYLLIILNVLQGNQYIEYMEGNPEQERFARGWLKRVMF
mgnify:CR=1 FL=1